MITSTNAVPNPGSEAARMTGCTCAVIDNYYGKGVPTKDGPQFWITQGCPLHWQVSSSTAAPHPPEGSGG